MSQDRSPAPADTKPNAGDFLVIGIGASAGGLEALSAVVKQMPASMPFAVVVVQHLDPSHESLLVELLAKVSAVPVEWAAGGRRIEAGRIFAAPPNSTLRVEHGRFTLESRQAHDHAIDAFLVALGNDAGHRSVAVVLSGNGTDGAEGVKAVKAAGGFTFAQEAATAAFPSMPDAAVETGSIDHVLPPAEIGQELVRLAHEASLLWSELEPRTPRRRGVGSDHLASVFKLLHAHTGVDFREYKESTIRRRLARRMTLTKVAHLADYLKLLQKDRQEVDLLFDSLLINVTEFFRDSDYFDFLRNRIVPEILGRHTDRSGLRMWVAGCATGEEAYSLAIVTREVMEERGNIVPVQIFATDVSEHAIVTARAANYTTADVASVSPERLRRFFLKTDAGHAVQKHIRDMVIFARQNVLRDSPFSRLDLLCCRNLMIYLSPTLQKKLLPIFHYALAPDGCLVLGSSESVGGYQDLFQLIDRRFRIYTRKPTLHRPMFELPVEAPARATSGDTKPNAFMPPETKEPFDITREADRIVLGRHGPAGVLVNDDLEIVQFRGDVSRYLAPTEGRASLNLLKMAREGLSAELQTAVTEARTKNVRVRRSGLTVMQGDTAHVVDLDVTPVSGLERRERYFLVLFTVARPRAGATPEPEPKPVASNKSVYLAQIDQLRQDLHATRNYLQATIEKHEATNQELRAANEEIQSSNEELQSTNEELETAKEELQSTNEELTTLNQELHSRQLELMHLNNDLTNLINSVHLPIIILDHQMRIRRFTPMAEKVMNVIPTDIGRPLTDININLTVKDLPRLITEVVDTLTIRELEVQDAHDRWYSLRLRPYKTAESRIDGVVLTLIDIHEMKRTIAELEGARDLARAVVDVAHEPLTVLNPELQIRTANEAFCRLLKLPREGAEERGFFDLVKDLRGDLSSALTGILPTGQNLTDRTAELDLPGVGPTRCLVNAHRVTRGQRGYPLILLALQVVH